MALEALGPRKWRYHGTPTKNYLSAGAVVHLEQGAYLFSGAASDPSGSVGGYMQIANPGGGYIQISPSNTAPKTFEVEVAGDFRFELMGRSAGNPIDLTATASLIRIGDAGGGLANLVNAEARTFVYMGNSTDVVEIGDDGISYKVSNDYMGTFLTVDVDEGAYRVERPFNGFTISSEEASCFYLNDYYTKIAKTDLYAGNQQSATIALARPGRLGFSLPQGEGVVHPSIVRIL